MSVLMVGCAFCPWVYGPDTATDQQWKAIDEHYAGCKSFQAWLTDTSYGYGIIKDRRLRWWFAEEARA